MTKHFLSFMIEQKKNRFVHRPLITTMVMALVLLPERHGQPDSHHHEGGPSVFWIEDGQEVTPHL
jgi:hypothetical protein